MPLALLRLFKLYAYHRHLIAAAEADGWARISYWIGKHLEL